MFRSISPILVASLVWFHQQSHGQVLFDGALGLPATQGWSFFATGGSQTLVSGAAQLDLSAANSFQGGYSLTSPTTLNHTNGFTLAFTAQMLAETHANNNRAGFSVILLSDDKRGLELAFWTNTIFAQSDSPLFTHAEDVAFNTTNGFVNYALTLRATNYVLQANGVVILTGPIRDYTAFSGFPNPYSSPNFIFIGDDTTSAGGAVALKKVVLVTAPQIVANKNKQITWTGVAAQSYSVQVSSNLVNWTTAQVVSSASSSFVFTNTSTVSPQFFRVSYP